ncbi:MAG: carbon starvation protein A [Planctomycetes bacterium]|nr:carbon starvation protein A [Planctomycetota bacterium]
MSLPLLAAAVVAVLTAGYAFYGRFVARQYALDDRRTTPATERADGVDYVPTPPFYLFGQHFSAIAAAGPILGPILACQTWGWGPCLLWIGLGVVFVGAVHDLTALVASVRHGASTVAEVARRHLGPRAWLSLTAFIWLALVYVVVAFTDATANTFLGQVEELPDGTSFDKGGGVAAAAVLYLVLAVVMGFVVRRFQPKTWVLSVVFVPLVLGCVWLGTVPAVSMVLRADATTWYFAILGYCVVASLVPVWTLLQPRGFLGGFVLYLALAAGVAGVFFGGHEIRQPAFATPPEGFGKDLFPFLFVTIACGACSGFHGLVCSGTTSKQIARESHCRPVGYGAMLLEAFVALIALSTVLVLSPSEVRGRPGAVFADGMASFLTLFVGEGGRSFARVFAGMALSTFIFDTLDVATRLGRYLLQELFGARSARAALLATLATVAVPLAILLAGGGKSFADNWLLFGSANQLLAGLTLLSAGVWLRAGGKRAWYVLAPAAFVLTVTTWSIGRHAVRGVGALTRDGLGLEGINGLVSVAMLALSTTFLVEALRAVRRRAAAGTQA